MPSSSNWGIPGVFIGRFFGPLRAAVPLIAGILEMDYWKFQLANVLSAMLWAYVLPGLRGHRFRNGEMVRQRMPRKSGGRFSGNDSCPQHESERRS